MSREIRKVKDYYPELVKYFKNPKDAEIYTIRSDKRIEVKCPDCGHEHIMIVKNLTKRHYNCPVCGSKLSFGERLILAIFDSLKINYIYQVNHKIFKWVNNFKYDFYLPDYNIIIEINGVQHLTTPFKFKNSRTVEKEQQNDLIKKELALANGISKVIYIDYSDRDILIYKDEICNKLKDYINVNDINWQDSISKASTSRLLEAINTWKKYKDNKTTKEIAEMVNIHSGTLVKYLHMGNALGFCSYNSQEERIKQNKKNAQKIKEIRTKKVNVYTIDNKFLGTFNGARFLSENSLELFNVDLRYQDIIAVCNGRQKTHRNLKFKYYDKDKWNKN